MKDRDFSRITPAIQTLAEQARSNGGIDTSLYDMYSVKRGLRDLQGNGVLTGLTEISEVVAKKTLPDGSAVPCEGELYYRGYNVSDLINGFIADGRFGFEETTYLLLFGSLPSPRELAAFKKILGTYRCIPPNFVRDIIMKKPSRDIMNAIARSVLMLYSYDTRADDISLPNVLRQCLQLISEFPLLAVYNYQAYHHYHIGGSLIIHAPDPSLSTAECILHLLRPNQEYTALEAQLLDLALILHAEHGGGNNSTFTTHVVTSSGSDTYSTMVASLGSLKGPKHGGANIMVVKMFEDIKLNVRDWDNEAQLRAYIDKILHKEAFDHTGLVYGMGHAVYTISDPREVLLKEKARQLAVEKDCLAEFELYSTIEKVAPSIIQEVHHSDKKVCSNVDFYSGFVYTMLNIPRELFTPLFAISRIAGWSAHRIEEIVSGGRIYRPAYKNVSEERPYIPMLDRK